MSQFFQRRVEKSNFEQKTDVKETSSVKTDVQTVERLNERTELSVDVTEEITIVKWSVPDSSGHQFVVETTNINRRSVTDKKSDLDVEKEQKEIIEIKEDKEDKSTINAKTEIKTVEKSKTKPATPAWITWAAVILSAGIIVLIYFVLKRYRIIK
jgi:hypothetical protein